MKNLPTYEEFLNEQKTITEGSTFFNKKTKKGGFIHGYEPIEDLIKILKSKGIKAEKSGDDELQYYTKNDKEIEIVKQVMLDNEWTQEEIDDIFENNELNERSSKNVTQTEWHKHPDSQHGDIFLSKRQGVFGVRDGDVLRPVYHEDGRFGDRGAYMPPKGFKTDKQFLIAVPLDAKKIADLYWDMWNKGLHTRENADNFGETLVELVNKIK